MFAPHPAEGRRAQDPRTDYQEPLDRERMIAQYDGDIAFGDRELGRFLRALRQAGRYDDAMVVFVADHGEEFLDHGRWLHGRSLFDELIRVPLVVKFPGNEWKGRRVAEQVQLVDVVPTVLASAGLPLPQDLEGRPLQDAVRGGKGPRPALAEISHRGFVAHGVRTDRDKFIRRFSPEEDELYFDLTRDPGERTNRAAENAGRVRLLQAQAEAGMAQNPFRFVLQLAGRARYELRIETRGWLEGVEATGFGPAERWTLRGNGRSIEIVASPRKDSPREIGFTVRPIGAPVQVLGSRDGRALREGDVLVGGTAFAPESFPFRLPDIESETDRDRGLELFTPPRGAASGVRLWLALPPGRKVEELDAATRERLKALGYVGPG
jgi:hypothetical protein